MKQFLLDLKQLLSVYLTDMWTKIMVLEIVFLLMILLGIGIWETKWIWTTVAVITATGYLLNLLYHKSQKLILPKRKELLQTVSSKAVCFALRNQFPYKYIRVRPEDLEHRSIIARHNGADIITVSVIIAEKNLREFDMDLVFHCLRESLRMFSRTSGLELHPYSQQYDLLSLLEVELAGRELLIRILMVDNR